MFAGHPKTKYVKCGMFSEEEGHRLANEPVLYRFNDSLVECDEVRSAKVCKECYELYCVFRVTLEG